MCVKENITKEELELKIQDCNKALAGAVCDKEQADLLWCMGRVSPGQYSRLGAVCSGWICFGSGDTQDGCDCSSFAGELRKCRMQNGIFDSK